MTIFDFSTLKKIVAPRWSTSVANPSVGRILRKGQKFRWGVKIQNISWNELSSWFISPRAAGVYIVLQD